MFYTKKYYNFSVIIEGEATINKEKVKYKIDENIFRGAAEKTFAKRDFDISSSTNLEILRDSNF